MNRVLFTVAVVLSLLLWAATAGLWAASVAGAIAYTEIVVADAPHDLQCSAKGLTIHLLTVSDWSGPFPPADRAWALPGCTYAHLSYGNGVEWTFELRWWLPLVAFGMLPALWLALFICGRTSHRKRRGFPVNEFVLSPEGTLVAAG